MKAHVLLVLVTLTLQMGCSYLIVRDDDEADVVTGKVASRVALGLVTLGISEIEISQIEQKEAREAQRQQMIENWNSALDRLTYDEALRRFGPPSSIAEGQDIFVAVWQSAAGPTLWIPGPSMGFGPTYLGAQAPGPRLELTFNRQSKLLRHWRKW